MAVRICLDAFSDSNHRVRFLLFSSPARHRPPVVSYLEVHMVMINNTDSRAAGGLWASGAYCMLQSKIELCHGTVARGLVLFIVPTAAVV